MKKKILSVVLCLAMVVGWLPMFVTPVRAATASQNNIVARADYLYGITWICKKTVYGWCRSYVFNSGSTYRIPYGQPINSGAYIGFGVSVDTFRNATKSASSVFYSSRSSYGNTSSVYYAMDCSAFVSWCWGISRKTTASIPQVSTNLGKATSANISKLQLGDALNSSSVGHVVLVTGLTYSGSAITKIEITEQTPPQLKRSYYTPSALASKYGSSYSIQRYSGTVPAAPGSGSGSGTTNSKYYPACASTQTSIVAALNNIGVDSSKDYRTKIAAANGISNYTGTEEQNIALLDLMKAGLLINPEGSSSDNTQNGYDRGYKGGMAGDGKIYAHGLDVSAWQGENLDFKAIKNAGYSYVILRAGTGNGKDTCFETYYTNARAAGLHVGAYYYSYATTVSAAKTDAGNMLSWIKGKVFEYPIYFDYEDKTQDNLSSTTAKNICLTFCNAMAEAGYLTGVYTGYSRATALPMSEICAKYEVWIARYYDYTYETLSPTYSGKYGMYQYTDRNYIGSKGPYDGNVAFKDYPSIVAQYGFNGYANTGDYLKKCTAYPTNCKVTTTQSTPLNTLPCSTASSYGSQTLLTSSANQTYTAKALYLNAAGNYWYEVTLNNGQTAYLFSGHCKYTSSVTTDLTLSDAFAPGILPRGEIFELNGTVVSQLNVLNQVQVRIATADGTVLAAVTGTAADNLCELSRLTLDFTTLEPGSYVYQVVGNYSGKYAASSTEMATYSAEKVLLNAIFTVLDSAPGTDPETAPYLDRCTIYPTNCVVSITANTPLNTLPSSTEYNGSQTLMTATVGQSYVASAVCCNTGGTYWYRIDLDVGQTVYLSGYYAKFENYIGNDISIANAVAPEALDPGESFALTGTVQSRLNKLDEVQVMICDADGTTVASAAVGAMDNFCDLSAMKIDFAALEAGSYVYRVVAKYSGSYAGEPTELADYFAQTVLMEQAFTVGTVTETEPERDPYLDRCTVYPAYCKVTTTKATTLNTLPSSTAYNGSQAVVNVQAGVTYTANALYCNTGGSYWYQITLDSGETVYLASNHVQYEKYTDSDITLTNAIAPGLLNQGEGFRISGTVQSLFNQLEEIQVQVLTSGTTAVITATGTVWNNRCNLSDIAMDFTALSVGSYVYRIVAKYSGSFAAQPTVRGDYSGQVVLMETSLTVKATDSGTEQDPYLERCTVFPAHCWVTTTRITPLNTLPSSTAYNGSQTVATVAADTRLLATAIYCNTGGNYWYEIQLDGGQKVYLSSNHSKFAENADSDILLTDVVLSEKLSLGAAFTVSGTVSAQWNRLEEVQVLICDANGDAIVSAQGTAEDNRFDLSALNLEMEALKTGDYVCRIIAKYASSYAADTTVKVDQTGQITLLEAAFAVASCDHSFRVNILEQETCTVAGILELVCTQCDETSRHTVEALGHSYSGGSCTTCGAADPDSVPEITIPTLTLKAPTLEFKDMIRITVFYTAVDTQDVVEMGMITYSSKVAAWSVETAEYVIPGATYDSAGDRYFSSSQGIHAKYLGDAVYLAVYAKLRDGTYAYSKLAPYSAVTYANNQLKNSTDVKLKKLVAAMLNYGAEAQMYFGHNIGMLANASLTADQKALPEVYRADMVGSVPAAPAAKQGIFANNQGFTSRKPAISFEDAFCINYFFAPKYAPSSGITLYYWNEADYNAASVLTTANATGKIKLEGSGTGEHRGDITGIAAKSLSEAVYVACAYRDSDGYVWTSGVLGYSIGSYCSSQASKGNTVSNLAMATAVYGYHAKVYFG